MKTEKKERTQQEILRAAKQVVHELGHEAITARRLADETGYAHTSLYYYFKDLNSLLWTLRLEMIEDMIAALDPGAEKKEDPVEELLAAFWCYADYFFDHPNVFRFFYFYPYAQPEENDRYREMEIRFQGMWATSFAGLVREKILRADDVDVVAKTIIYTLQGMLMLHFSANGSLDRKTVKYELDKIIRRLLKPGVGNMPGGIY